MIPDTPTIVPCPEDGCCRVESLDPYYASCPGHLSNEERCNCTADHNHDQCGPPTRDGGGLCWWCKWLGKCREQEA